MGNFDGVHTAHRMLLSAAIRLAKQTPDCHSAVFFFDPPSSQVLYPGTELLSTISEKLDAFRQCGIEYAYLADFSSFKSTPADSFVQDILLNICRADAVVCGFNFRFGQGGRGNVELLKQLLGEENVCIIPPCCMPVHNQNTNQVISSSAIRQALSIGDIRATRVLLGFPYAFSAPVLPGKQLGRKMGIPTINQNPPQGKALPANGVYVTQVRIEDACYFGVSNIGVHPTVDSDAARNCETHLLNFEGDLYGHTVTVEFLEQIRPERKFDSVEELRRAILSDIAQAKRFFNRAE
jgi:riboflavin kinase/FMN adenylyltransferase